ncbi:MAG: hypothetical protein AB1374_06295 [Bacillota bacterium]
MLILEKETFFRQISVNRYIIILVGAGAAVFAYLQGFLLDREPPKVAIVSPAWDKRLQLDAGSNTVSEVVQVRARDNRYVKMLELLIDGVPVHTAGGSGILTYKWQAGEGKHTLEVAAYDRCGNKSKSLPLIVSVEKPVSQPVDVYSEGQFQTVQPDFSVNMDLITREVQVAVDKWVRTACEKDLTGHVECYADQLDRYYNKYNVTKDELIKSKEEMMTKYDIIDIQVSDVKVDVENRSSAVATFKKTWDARGRETFAGEEIQRLRFQKSRNKWKITSEEEVEIYWVTVNGKRVM